MTTALTKFKEMGRLIVMSDCGQVAEVKGFCKITGSPYSVTVRHKDWRKYAQGVYPAAECFPYLCEKDRGILITGCIEPDSGL